MAAGVGGVKASLPAHGADQLDRSDQRAVSAFFNWFFFALCLGGLGAATGMVWVQENKGWDWSFNISIIILTLALCIFTFGFPFYRYRKPSGSPLSRIFKVRYSCTDSYEFSFIYIYILHILKEFMFQGFNISGSKLESLCHRDDEWGCGRDQSTRGWWQV